MIVARGDCRGRLAGELLPLLVDAERELRVLLALLMDKPVVIRPSLPAINAGHIEGLLERDELITLDGEVLDITEGSSDDVVAWIVAMKRIRDLARRMEDRCNAVMLERVGQHAGPIETEYGTARQSVSRGSVSGIQSQRIRAILEEAAADEKIPWDVVDNLAPLQAHVTPARLADYLESSAPEALADELGKHLPEKRRTLKVEERLG